MISSGDTTIAVLAGLGAAAAFGVGVALQHRQAQLTPAGRTPLRLLASLARRPLWVAGNALAVAAYGLQALALAFGPLALVAPVTAIDLVFGLPLAARWSGRVMRIWDWAGCVLATGGVAVFLVTSPPSEGRLAPPARNWLLAFAVIALACAALATSATFAGSAARPALLATAAGIVFGLTAAVTLSLTRLLRHQPAGSLLGHWQPWALIALGTAGLLLSATAHQAGPLSASLPVVDTVEPICAVLLGTLVFGERLAASPAALLVQLAGAAAAVAGIVLLGRPCGPGYEHS